MRFEKQRSASSRKSLVRTRFAIVSFAVTMRQKPVDPI